MKIAQINPGFMEIPPNKWGAIEKIIWYYKLESERKAHEVHIKYINEISKGEYDIVHTHVWNHALEMAEKGIPYVFTFHDHHAYVHGKNSQVYRNNLNAMKQSELSIVPAKFLIDYFEGLPIYLRHGIDPNEFYVGTTNHDKKLLIVGNNGLIDNPTFDRKGFRYAIEAAEQLNMPITVVGPTNVNKQFFTYHSDLIKPNVTFRYDLTEEELCQVYRTHDILIHATAIEAGHPPLTILEAASSGLPIITTDCSGDLHTTRTTRDSSDVSQKVKWVLENYESERQKTIQSVKDFYWTNVVDELLSLYGKTFEKKNMRESILNVYNKSKIKNNMKNYINVHFIDGPFVEITGQYDELYTVKFIDADNESVVYETSLKTNHWARCSRRWNSNWKIQVISSKGDVVEHRFNPDKKKVLISIESASLGDTLAWIPYVDEFQKKYNSHVVVSTFLNELFESEYPNLEFVKPGSTVYDLYALYRIGWFYDGGNVNYGMNKNDFTKIPLQQTASDILGIEYREILPRIVKSSPHQSDKPYICIANHSTAQSKYWNNETGWQELVDYVKSLGYDVYLLSRENDGYMGNKNPDGVIKIDNKSLQEIGSLLLGSRGFVGLGSGLSWYAWSLGVPTVLISGFSERYQEMSGGVHRVINESVCHGCFARHMFDRGDWNWCPDHKGTLRQFECTKEISFGMVKEKLDLMLKI